MKEKTRTDALFYAWDFGDDRWLANQALILCDTLEEELQEANKKLKEVEEALNLKGVESPEEPDKARPREILFRGWGCNGEGWVYGGHAEYSCEQVTGSLIIDLAANTKYTYAKQGLFEQQAARVTANAVIVVPESVGQYTGITDCCGAKIFEGDTVGLDDTDMGGSIHIGDVVFNTDPALAWLGWGLWTARGYHVTDFLGNVTLLKTPDHANKKEE